MSQDEFPINPEKVDALHESLVSVVNEHRPTPAELALATYMTQTSHTEAQKEGLF